MKRQYVASKEAVESVNTALTRLKFSVYVKMAVISTEVTVRFSLGDRSACIASCSFPECCLASVLRCLSFQAFLARSLTSGEIAAVRFESHEV